MKTQKKQLYYLHELTDYKIDGGYTDIRGWNVKDSALRNIGTVKNLLVNKETKRVVYVDVEVDPTIIDASHDAYGEPSNTDIREFINEKGENHIIIPIGLVEINLKPEYIFTESIDHHTFAGTKRIRKNSPIDRDYENAVLSSFRRRISAIPERESGDLDIENDPEYQKDRREAVRDQQESIRFREGVSPDNDTNEDWSDAENETFKDGEIRRNEDYYTRREFDDSRFNRDKN